MSVAMEPKSGTLEVVIDPSVGMRNHSHAVLRAFRDAATHLKGVLQALHCSRGTFTLRPIEQRRWMSQDRVLVRSIAPTRNDSSFEVRIRPGDNGSAWDYMLTVPSDMSATSLQQQMISFFEKQGTPLPKIDQHAPAEPACPAATTPQAPAAEPETPTQELGNLFSRLHAALMRKEQRDSEMAELKTKIAAAKSLIEMAEARQLEIMDESEKDMEANEAQSLLASLRMFSASPSPKGV